MFGGRAQHGLRVEVFGVRGALDPQVTPTAGVSSRSSFCVQSPMRNSNAAWRRAGPTYSPVSCEGSQHSAKSPICHAVFAVW